MIGENCSDLKVLHVIPGIARRYGGPSEVIRPLVTALNEVDGVRADVVTTDADGAGERLALADLPHGLPIRMFRRNVSERWKVSLGLQNWLRQRAGDYDLLHIHALWSFATAAATRAARRRGVPYIVRPAGMLSEYTWQRHRWQKRAYWRLIERHNIEHATAFHATSDAEAAEIRALRPDAHVFVIPNGVDDEAFDTPRADELLRTRMGAANSDLPIVLFLSRLHPKKGIVDRLLPAVSAMRSACRIAIAGGEDPHAPGHAQEICQAIDKLGLGERVTTLGPVSPAERWAMFDGADVFVLPSHSENFGIVVAEAMARGCPVIVTDAVQSCEHVRAASAGDVVPDDVAALAAALERMISQPVLRRACGASGRNYAQEHFRWNQIATQICDLYRDCLSRR
jgi:glycosyltransferase involved in cell wall biosynthesis